MNADNVKNLGKLRTAEPAWEQPMRSAWEQPKRGDGEYEYDFAKLGEKVAQSLVQAAQDQVTEATNNLERVKAFAAGLRSQIAEKNRELAEMKARLQSFGTSILDAHRKFSDAAESIKKAAEPAPQAEPEEERSRNP